MRASRRGKCRDLWIAGVVVLELAGAGCQRSGGPTSVAILSLSLVSPTAVGTLPNPCELDVDFGSAPVNRDATATIEVRNNGNAPVTFAAPTAETDLNFLFDFTSLKQPLQPGSAARIPVTFGPRVVGQLSSVFSLSGTLPAGACGSSRAPLEVKLAGQGAVLSLIVSPETEDFGNTLVGSTAKHTVTLTNQSAVAVAGIVGGVAGPDQVAFSVANVPAWLDAGASAEVDVGYQPDRPAGLSAATVTFAGSGGESAFVSLTGEPVDSLLVLSPPPIDFGYAALGTSVVECTTITNQANLPATISGIDLSGQSDAFAVSQTDGASLPNPTPIPTTILAGARASVCFSFTPSQAQRYIAGAKLKTDDPSGSNPLVVMSGWGGGPQISCVPGTVAFAETLANTTSTVPVICTNTGTDSAGVNLIIDPPTASPGAFSAAFDQSVDPYPIGGLAPGQSAQIDVSYRPTASSTDNGALSITSNGGQGQVLQIPLKGQGLSVQPCQLIAVPAALDFGNVPSGETSVPLAFALENVGADVCVIEDVGVQDDSAGNFHVLTTSIQPDPGNGWIIIPAPSPGVVSSLTVTADFAPAAQGAATAELFFTVGNPSSPNQTVALSGTSEATCLMVVPSSLSFGTVGEGDGGVLCGGPTRTFSVFNTCSVSATLSSITLQSGPGDLVPQFSEAAGPVLPLVVRAGGAAPVFEVAFAPATLGSHTAELLVSDGTVDALLSLNGSAVSTGTETDSFVVGPPKADVLFVLDVDDDFTEQEQIVNEAPTFFAAAPAIDFRIAVTTDNDDAASASAEFGRLLPCPTCSIEGPTPTIISPSSVPAGGTGPDPVTVFEDLLGSVRNNAYAVGSPNDEHLFLATFNALQRGPSPGVDFFRQGAYFAVITDNGDSEDDTSALGVGGHDEPWFASFFEAFFQQPSLFSWNYVDPTVKVTGTGLADPLQVSAKVESMITATGGMALNSADSNWPIALGSLWSAAIAVGDTRPLEGTPVGAPDSISIDVGGKPLPQLSATGTVNWTYQAGSNAIVFPPSTAPAAGSQIRITYPIGCP